MSSCTVLCEALQLNFEASSDEGVIYKPTAVAEQCRRVFEACRDAVRPDKRLICLGGDHSISIGSIGGIFEAYSKMTCKPEGLLYDQPIVIWFDAHADINTLKTTISGNIHGCPVAFLLNHPDTQGLVDFNWFYQANSEYAERTRRAAFLEASRLAYIGLRDVEEGEMVTIQDLGIHDAWFMEDIKERSGRDMAEVVGSILKSLDPEGRRPIHLSLDVDGIDPEFAPSTGTPVPGGLTLDETIEIVRILRGTGRLLSADIVEVNILLGTQDDSEKTLKNTIAIIKELLL